MQELPMQGRKCQQRTRLRSVLIWIPATDYSAGRTRSQTPLRPHAWCRSDANATRVYHLNLGWFVQHYEEWLLLVGPAVYNKGSCRGRGAVIPHKMRGFGGNQSNTARAKFL